VRRGLIGGLVAIAVAVSVTLGFFWARGTRATPIGPGDPLPPVELRFAMADASSKLDAIRGEPLLLLFVETSSPGGRAFANTVELLHRRYMRRGLNLVAIALDTDRGALQKMLGADAITYQVLHDPGARATSATFGVSQPGDAYLVGADGRVTRVFVSPEDWSDRRVAEAIEGALRQKPH
jgi:hypothetical protein